MVCDEYHRRSGEKGVDLKDSGTPIVPLVNCKVHISAYKS